ncbi:transcriptional regulator, TetR family [Marinitoga hydrogenitolerans DSM 16785]|uniref:Transcriptional regulator, TetR family n=1 Tax=Marinitoga hydrogenitolerans (strain DSM 16785 / JCM 12826 / AT1271) TaxID=1122195 RepID=A0A1M4XBD0_MARH1|nr:TetR/AcrR family transcriptional regulator [Marinitoga hydrogenitolerans]SHE90492.1 transcriptional regulator, TetR family [Marinitoga hydrogenitolerans DSM 16785]
MRKANIREKIIDSAIELFSKKWYETVSVAEICRNANLSNGVFYNYFKNKQQLFEYLLNYLLEVLKNEFYKYSGNTKKEKLKSFFNIVFGAAKKYKTLVTIFREGQYRFPQYEKELRNLYIDILKRILDREITEVDYIYIIGGLRFLGIMSSYGWINMNVEDFFDIVFNGVFFEKTNDNKLFDFDIKECEEEEKTTKQLLINAGIDLFSQKGYYKVKIFEITNYVSLAVGTFYIYFPSKEEFLKEIVRQIGHKTRLFISKNLPLDLNRLEKELIGIYLFLEFFKRNKNYYEIIREAEFVVNNEVREYYAEFKKGYIKHLRNIKNKNKEVTAMYLMGISHYTGIEYLFENTIKDKKKFLFELSKYLTKGINIKA